MPKNVNNYLGFLIIQYRTQASLNKEHGLYAATKFFGTAKKTLPLSAIYGVFSSVLKVWTTSLY